jgi:hypothetical protein
MARQGRYSEAIEAFKAADRIAPRAVNACLIALAYTRRELWPQAEIFLDMCQKRVTADDPAPEWLPAARQHLAERLSAIAVAEVEISVVPAAATLTVSSFARDEHFAPRTIHLPVGRHVIVATADGYITKQTTIEVNDRAKQRVTITLERTAPHPPPSVPSSHPAASRVPWIMLGTGGALVLTGAALHAFWFKPARDELLDADRRDDRAAYDTWSPRFDQRRNVTVGVYAAGLVTIGAAIALRYTVFADREAPAQIAIEPRDGGGIVSIGWQR